VKAEIYHWMAISQSELGYPADVVRSCLRAAHDLPPESERIAKNAATFEATIGRRPPARALWEMDTESHVRAISASEYWPAPTA
jgi:hypothetical protein